MAGVYKCILEVQSYRYIIDQSRAMTGIKFTAADINISFLCPELL
jgi:hypothetical protein